MSERRWYIDLTDSGNIGLRLDGFDPRVNADIKSAVPGRPRWSKPHQAWLLPLDFDSCLAARRVADKYGVALQIGPDLNEWARAEKARRADIPDPNEHNAVDVAAIERDFPRLFEAMSNRPFQTVGAAFAARNRRALIADDPGLGKTLQSIGAVIEAGLTGPILVVAPKSAVYDTWPRELALWAPGDQVIIIGPHLKPAQRKERMQWIVDWQAAFNESPDNTYGNRMWILVGPNYLRAKASVDEYGHYVYDPQTRKKIIKPVRESLPEFFEIEWATVIVDESHRCLAGATGNVKKQSAQRQGLGALRVRENGLRIAISGTPFRGKKEYAWGTLNWLRPDRYMSFWNWAKSHFDVYNDGYGWVVGRMKSEDAFYAELADVMIRRTKAEVAADLPPKMYGGWPLDPADPKSPVAVWLNMEAEQSRVYNEMANYAISKLEEGDLMANGILAIMTRLKQFACASGQIVGDEEFRPSLPSNKFDWLVEFLNERGLDKDTEDYSAVPKVIVASQFRQLLERFAEGLAVEGIECHMFTGSTTAKQREQVIEDWQNNPDSHKRVLLLTTTAGGVSLTLDQADDVVLLDETWNPDDSTQLEDRAHRLSRIDHNVSIWKLKTLGTIEEAIAATLREREDSILRIIDGSRGVETAKQLIGASK